MSKLSEAILKRYCDPDFMVQFDAEHGTNLSHRGNPMEVMIYQVSGQLERDMKLFVDTVAASVLESNSATIH